MRPYDWILPGLGHLRHGFAKQSRKYLLFMGAWVVVVIFRWDRIAALAAGNVEWAESIESWVALGFLAVWPLVWMWAARRGLHRLLEPPLRTSLSQWQVAMGLFRKNKRGAIGLRILGLAYMIAFLCPVLSPYDPERLPRAGIVLNGLRPFATVYVLGDSRRGEWYCRSFKVDPEDPDKLLTDRVIREVPVPFSRIGEPRRGWKHPPTGVATLDGHEVPYRAEFYPLGTDELGHDLLSNLIYGSRISLSIGFVAMLIAVVIGAIVGTVAGFFGGWIDVIMMRFVDILMAFPRLLLLMLIYAGYAAAKETASIFVIVAILGATGWMGISRLVRAQILSLKEQDFTMAAHALGIGKTRIMFRHLLPNAMAPLIVDATLRVGNTILLEAALSFLGFGVQKPTPSWGNIIDSGKEILDEAWWVATFPGLAIVFVVVSFNLVGDALRDALDPKLRE